VGVVSQLWGGGLPPNGGVKISLLTGFPKEVMLVNKKDSHTSFRGAPSCLSL